MRKLLLMLPVALLLSVLMASGSLYDITNITSSTNIYMQTKAFNDLTDGVLGMGLILIAFSITFVAVSENTGEGLSGVTAGAFIATISSLIMLPLNLVGWPVFTYCIITLGLSTAASIIFKKS